MAIDFPDSPSNNDIYTVNGKRWIYSNGKWSIYGSTAPDATASDTEPTGVGDGHIWYRSDESQTLIRYDNTWVEVGSAGGFDSSSTSFPTSLDSATGFAAVEALQAKVGADSSAVTTSHDYILTNGVLPTLNVDSGVLVVDDTNNRVGVNDSTPSYALDVTGDINATGDLRIGGTQVGEWIDYSGTQTFGGLTVGNGTLVSFYSRVKDIVFMRGYFQLGSTSTMTGPLDMSVPAASQAAVIQEWTGHVRFWDQSGSIFYAGTALSLGSSTYRMSYMGVSAGLLGNYDLSPTAPFTWTTGDAFFWSFYYQAA